MPEDLDDPDDWTADDLRLVMGTGLQPAQESYRIAYAYPPAQRPRENLHVRPPRPSPLLQTPPGFPRPAELQQRQSGMRGQRTWPQMASGVLIAAAVVAGAAFYVPRVIGDNRDLLTGTVTTSGLVALNFGDSGEIRTVNVRLGQTVRKGQLLAVENDSTVTLVEKADSAAIASDQAKIAQIQAMAAPDAAALAAATAQLAKDQAQMAAERTKITGTEIVAPSDGEVVALNGQPGESVTASGVQNRVSESEEEPTAQAPKFSLLPEGPQPGGGTSTSASALSVITLRTSDAWRVDTVVPEGSVSKVKAGQDVTISVPAAGIANVRGRIDEVLPAPASTSAGVVYQAVVTVVGHVATMPLDGMAADIRLGS